MHVGYMAAGLYSLASVCVICDEVHGVVAGCPQHWACTECPCVPAAEWVDRLVAKRLILTCLAATSSTLWFRFNIQGLGDTLLQTIITKTI